jgi:hypothetical protein
MTFGALETLHQAGQVLDGLVFVLIDDNSFNLLLVRIRKHDLFICHLFHHFLCDGALPGSAQMLVEEPAESRIFNPAGQVRSPPRCLFMPGLGKSAPAPAH